MEVGLHQRSALSPFLYENVMDGLTDEIGQESPWTMMFAVGKKSPHVSNADSTTLKQQDQLFIQTLRGTLAKNHQRDLQHPAHSNDGDKKAPFLLHGP